MEGDAWNNFKRNLKFYLSRKINRALIEPDYFMISLTDHCNLRCRMCGCPETSKRYAGEELSTEEIKNIINQIELWKRGVEVVFSGGEPFVRKDILELIDYVCSKDLKLSINTNGMFIDQEVADALAGYPVYHLNFSLDADAAEVNDSIRGETVFLRVLQSIHALNEAKKKYKNDRPLLSINTTIMKQNIESISNMISLAKKYNIQNVFFQPVITDNTDFQKRGECLFLNKEEFNILGDSLRKIKSQAGENQINIQIPSLSLLKEYFMVRDNNYSSRQWKCFVGYNRIAISSFGHVYSCSEKFGDIRMLGLKEIWHSQRANMLRKKFKQCREFCLQTCYARPESESIAALMKNLKYMLFKK